METQNDAVPTHRRVDAGFVDAAGSFMVTQIVLHVRPQKALRNSVY